MRCPSCFLWSVAALISLTGCAATTAPLAAATPVAPIAVSCSENSLSDAPCIAMARRNCTAPQVDTIQLVLATPMTMDGGAYTKQRYDYRATYNCPVSVTSATE